MKTLIIDVSHLFYKLVYKMPDLSVDEQETSIIFGMLVKIIELANKFKTNKFIFAFDSKNSERKKIYPKYKENRNKKEKTEEEKLIFKTGFEQLELLRTKILPSLGFKNLFYQDGYESDDIIAKIVLNDNSSDFIIVSSDEDLFQLLKDNVKIYNTNTKNIYAKKDFIEEYGVISPEVWKEIKCIGGCKSDNIYCISGSGFSVKSAIKFVKGELPSHHKIYKEFITKEAEERKNLNYKLVVLPFEGTNNPLISKKEKFIMKDFISICSRYRMDSLLNGSSYSKWEKIMCNNG